MLAEAVRFERTCPEGAVAFQATELPVAQRLRMEESNGIEPSSPGERRYSRPVADHPPVLSRNLAERAGLEPARPEGPSRFERAAARP